MGRFGYRAFNRDVKGHLRYTRFQFIRATRCVDCEKPIILTVVQGERPRLMPIDAVTWDGNSYYVKGKHKPHAHSCPSFIQHINEYNALRLSDLFVEG